MHPHRAYVPTLDTRRRLSRLVQIVAFGIVSATLASAISLIPVETKLRPDVSEAQHEDHFGGAIAMFGDRLAVGIPDAALEAGPHQGVVNVYRKTPDGDWIIEVKLTAPDARRNDKFGQSVAMDGNTLIVAARREMSDTNTAAVLIYVYRLRDSGWALEDLIEPLPDWLDRVDRISIAISGDRFVVGSPYDDGSYEVAEGAAYVFHRTANDWVLEQRLTARDPKMGANFGFAVDISGDRIAVSAPRYAKSPEIYHGAAYLFERNGDAWVETGKIVRPARRDLLACDIAGGLFGSLLKLSDESLIVALTTSVDGCLLVFRPESTNDWELDTIVEPLTTTGFRRFGTAIALDEQRLFVSDTRTFRTPANEPDIIWAYDRTDWTFQSRIDSTGDQEGFGFAIGVSNGVVAVGSPLQDGLSAVEQGAVSLFESDSDNWRLSATLRRGDAILSDNDALGGAVAILDDLLIATATGDCDQSGCYQGSAFVFKRDGDDWIFQQKLLPPDAQPNALFGSGLAADGDHVVIGAQFADTSVAPDAGAVYVYRRVGETLQFESKLSALDGEQYDRFGGSVALSGNRLVVGAPGADAVNFDPIGAAYVFVNENGEWIQQARVRASDPVRYSGFAESVAISANRMVVGAYRTPNNYHGAAYVFLESNGAWSEETRLTASNSGWFGLAVAIDGNTIAVGAPQSAGNYGRVYFFEQSNNIWQQQAFLQSASAATRFGQTVALLNNYALVGAGSESSESLDHNGACHLYHRDGDIWIEDVSITASDTHSHQSFGSGSVALRPPYAIVGVPGDGNGTGLAPGAVYSYFLLCPGDVNGDWSIDTTDLAQLLASYGTPNATRESGDFDSDGDVDIDDLATLLSNWGKSCP